ncbi:uncharacterized protein DEA37_0006471 [Paragonimus westermani]|uniref:Uncharacterized protein n=1 Tax=Paragonimus westermani TaxID=34504 RepID=A0A5J4NE28_9TREM|nr:uncharacterized protein DEA37_0006471 [Paragonimus westermani]
MSLRPNKPCTRLTQTKAKTAPTTQQHTPLHNSNSIRARSLVSVARYTIVLSDFVGACSIWSIRWQYVDVSGWWCLLRMKIKHENYPVLNLNLLRLCLCAVACPSVYRVIGRLSDPHFFE